ncbi:MAG: aldehyde dehydrogenase family protein, partial [Cyclobacteriaceae bacterium]|nr:aldehyde dehydrogenase family protein [Cyclobacteriaceae bacterium]
MVKILNYINGALAGPSQGQYMDNFNPAEGKVYSLVPDSGIEDVANAVTAAMEAFPSWSVLPVEKRSRMLQRLADLVDRDLDKLALAESIDTGKPVLLARRMDIPRAAANIRFFATAMLHFSSEAHITDSAAINYTTRTPVGVAGCISPWNLPLYLFTWKIAPALAAGCTVV